MWPRRAAPRLCSKSWSIDPFPSTTVAATDQRSRRDVRCQASEGHRERSASPRSVVGLILFACAVAGAAKPVKGGSYAGGWTTSSGAHFGLSFKVSKSGKAVSAMTLPNGEPIFCQGGGFGTPVAQAKAAKVSKRGTFS